GEMSAAARPPAPLHKRGHALALTGISLTSEQLLPYGLFVVAEAAGSSYSASMASRRTVQVITEQVASSLANDQALEGEQLATLLKLAVVRASLDLYQQRICTPSDLGVAVTGALLLGETAHVVNVGHCRTYLFRPDGGLQQITTDHSVVSCLAENGLLEQEALYLHPRRNQIYRSIAHCTATASQVDTFAISIHRGDVLLLCSPDVWQRLRQQQIEAILHTQADPRSAALTLARDGVGQASAENFSVIVVHPQGEWVPSFGIYATKANLPHVVHQ